MSSRLLLHRKLESLTVGQATQRAKLFHERDVDTQVQLETSGH